jgi:hypothetical protein
MPSPLQVELVMETYRTRMEDLLDRIAEIGRQVLDHALLT